MLDALMTMQKEGFFKLIPNNELDTAVRKLKNNDDLELIYDDIQNYLKNLYDELYYKSNVKLGNAISDFEDKFSYEMFEMPFADKKLLNGVYQKEITYGEAGNFSFGIEMLTAKFTLEEQKLLKLINHYYISLMGTKTYTANYFFIPLESLRLIFPKVNNMKLKEKLIKTCTELSSKKVYWDFNKTRYRKDLEKEQLNVGNKEAIVDINVFYYPKKNKNGVNGESVEIKGIVCNISKFMKLRYSLKQISNRFPLNSFQCNYLGFIIASKIDYRLNTMKIGNDKKKQYVYEKNLRDLISEIYLYRNGEMISNTYRFQITNEPNSKTNILKLLEAIMIVLSNLSDSLSFTPVLKVSSTKLDLQGYLDNIHKVSNKVNKESLIQEQIEDLYDKIASFSHSRYEKAKVRRLILNGLIILILKFK